ncbi:FKBP-type peptidyl-prolyl cis-trans isomerase [Ferruginibacter albus]|uniref:FKBP-type peptidyl-prolyl cis-trans isomerase n=1 Tax=Ferruginibacter albus TaxID=2875540 RepID=UPI001CC79D4F|nr:FKBP-type peptidyl-prolyl cis-trans isomerase [Ferruginibacter albus]UAY52472.1 FKBP-type peptidyl-prolyl cis-trans isomerase [Ferruginibacter albus]
MKKAITLSIFFAITLFANTNGFSQAKTTAFQKSKNGMLYQIISNGQGRKLMYGNFFEIQVDQFYKDAQTDTILMSSKERGGQMGKLDSTNIPADYFLIFKKVRKGDKVIVKMPTDIIIKNNPHVPSFIKKGQFLVTTYKIVNIYTTQQQVDSAQKKLAEAMSIKDSIYKSLQMIKDDKIITDYLAKNNIVTVKAPKGTYVHIINPGEGNLLDTGVVPKVKYKGWSMSTGKVFDSNIDSSFKHTDAFSVDLKPEDRQVIEGWLDALPLLKKGAKATIFIPSSLAYGKRGAGADIKPNENLVFDVDIVDVISTAQHRVEAQAEAEKRAMMQKQYMDSSKSNKGN